jgi:hypothetical protein
MMAVMAHGLDATDAKAGITHVVSDSTRLLSIRLISSTVSHVSLHMGNQHVSIPGFVLCFLYLGRAILTFLLGTQ